jgi:hypothetical protein
VTNHRTERELGLLFGMKATLTSFYNYINTNHYKTQVFTNKNNNYGLIHIAEIQERYLNHLDIDVATKGTHPFNLFISFQLYSSLPVMILFFNATPYKTNFWLAFKKSKTISTLS